MGEFVPDTRWVPYMPEGAQGVDFGGLGEASGHPQAQFLGMYFEDCFRISFVQASGFKIGGFGLEFKVLLKRVFYCAGHHVKTVKHQFGQLFAILEAHT